MHADTVLASVSAQAAVYDAMSTNVHTNMQTTAPVSDSVTLKAKQVCIVIAYASYTTLVRTATNAVAHKW
eukprot:19464-Heterococcus_DN1.PRE.2